MSTLLHQFLPWGISQTFPELKNIQAPLETHAQCTSCRLLCKKGENKQTWHFHENTRCCTFYPVLYNWQLGQILKSNHPEAISLLRREMEQERTFNSLRFYPPDSYAEKQKELQYPIAFGKKEELLCPFYVTSTNRCGIWAHRNSICRAWYCMHTEGGRALGFWNTLRMLANYYEKKLGEWCIHTGEHPSQSPPRLEEHLPWYIQCAERVENISEEEAMKLRTPVVEEILENLLKYYTQLHQEMPDILRSSISKFERTEKHAVLFGYSEYAPILAPKSIFLFLSKLDGKRTWKEALQETQQQSPEITEKLIVQMFKQELLHP